jgi:hypothetical protein
MATSSTASASEMFRSRALAGRGLLVLERRQTLLDGLQGLLPGLLLLGDVVVYALALRVAQVSAGTGDRLRHAGLFSGLVDRTLDRDRSRVLLQQQLSFPGPQLVGLVGELVGQADLQLLGAASARARESSLRCSAATVS